MTGSQNSLDSRLRILEQVLGQVCRLSAEIPEEENLPNKLLAPDIRPPTEAVMVPASTTELDICARFTHCASGDKAPDNTTFCSWNSVISYPDLFIGKRNRPIAQPFFDDVAHCGDWDYFYLHNPKRPSKKPLIFVTTEQFEFYLRFINRRLGLALKLPNGTAKSRFVLRFGQNLPRPRYLTSSHGTWQLKEFSKTENEDKKLENFADWPSIDMADIQEFNNASITAQQTWMAQWARICSETQKRDELLTSEKRFENRMQQHLRQLKQSQDLLGLGGCSSDAVFISIDVEWLESGNRPVSEIGIAILDTRKLKSMHHLQNKGFWDLVEAHHCRTYEYAGLRNHRFVQGCPDKFEFGESTFPHFKELAHEVNKIIKQYDTRDKVLVGHGIGNDLRCMDSIGVTLADGAIAQLDTQIIHQAWKRSDSSRSLEAVLNDLDYQPRHLHNAGNDAVWTLRALIGIASQTCGMISK